MDTNIKQNIISENTIYIFGEFDDSIIELMPKIKEEIDKQSKNNDKKIIFRINSNGGQLRMAVSLLNLIEYAKKQNIIVETIVDYSAYSCASLLACSGTIGHRYISEYGHHLCHHAQKSFYSATPKQLSRNEKLLREEMDTIVNIYKKYCTQTAKDEIGRAHV